jgi:S1-C subfamily serine protease
VSGTQDKTLDVTVMQSPKDPTAFFNPADTEHDLIPRLGALVVPVTAELAGQLGTQRMTGGLLVVARTFGAAAAEISLKAGDVIYDANGRKLETVEDLRSFMQGLKSGDPVVLQIERDNLLSFVSFRFEE